MISIRKLFLILQTNRLCFELCSTTHKSGNLLAVLASLRARQTTGGTGEEKKFVVGLFDEQIYIKNEKKVSFDAFFLDSQKLIWEWKVFYLISFLWIRNASDEFNAVTIQFNWRLFIMWKNQSFWFFGYLQLTHIHHITWMNTMPQLIRHIFISQFNCLLAFH